MIHQYLLKLPALPRGFHIIDKFIFDSIKAWPEEGLLNIFLQHTSAALAINEGADPDVRSDLETIFNDLVPESRHYKHSQEGPDDMPSHAKAILAGSSLNIPIRDKKLALGRWQSIYLCEFRDHGGSRNILLTLLS